MTLELAETDTSFRTPSHLLTTSVFELARILKQWCRPLDFQLRCTLSGWDRRSDHICNHTSPALPFFLHRSRFLRQACRLDIDPPAYAGCPTTKFSLVCQPRDKSDSQPISTATDERQLSRRSRCGGCESGISCQGEEDKHWGLFLRAICSSRRN